MMRLRRDRSSSSRGAANDPINGYASPRPSGTLPLRSLRSFAFWPAIAFWPATPPRPKRVPHGPTPLQCRGNQHLRRPTAQLYGAGAFSSIVVDIRKSQTDIAPIYDGLPLPAARTTAHIGTRHFESLAYLLRANTIVITVLADERADLPPTMHPAALHASGVAGPRLHAR
jgi:hypothetical protein